MIFLLLTLLAAATLQDLLRREVSNAFPLLIAAAGVFALWADLWQLHWTAVLLGPLVGLMLAGPFFHFGILGGGDVKLVMALGVWFGPIVLVWILLLTAAFGGLLAGIAKLRGHEDLAYVPAITAGVLLHVCLPNLFLSTLNLSSQ